MTLSLVGLVASPAGAHPVDDPLPKLDFIPPEPGTYELHRIMPAPDGEVLSVDGRAQRLSRFTRGRIAYVREIYTSTFLHVQSIMSDVKTLLMEGGDRPD